MTGKTKAKFISLPLCAAIFTFAMFLLAVNCGIYRSSYFAPSRIFALEFAGTISAATDSNTVTAAANQIKTENYETASRRGTLKSTAYCYACSYSLKPFTVPDKNFACTIGAAATGGAASLHINAVRKLE